MCSKSSTMALAAHLPPYCRGTTACAILAAAVSLATASAAAIAADGTDSAFVTSVVNPETGTIGRVATDEVIVEFEPQVDAAAKSAVAARVAGTVLPSRNGNQRHAIRLRAGDNPFTVAQDLKRDPRVRLAYPNAIGSFSTVPDEPDLGAWWFLAPQGSIEERSIGLTEFWSTYDGTNHSSVVVVLFDSGLDIGHEEFAGEIADQNYPLRRIQLFPSFIPQAYVQAADVDPHPPDGFDEYTSPRDFLGHGTGMAGLIGAIEDNDVAIAGVAHDNPLWIFKIGQIGAGEGDIRLDDVVSAMEFFLAEIEGNPSERFVANMSMGFTYENLGADGVEALREQVSALDETDKCVILAATGNEDNVFWDTELGNCYQRHTPTWRMKYPAAYSGAYGEDFSSVVAVGASRLIAHGGTDQCACGGPLRDASLRAWGEYSRYGGPDPAQGQPECTPIVDILAPGGARKALSTSNLTCDSLNVLSTALHTQGNPAKTNWGYGTSNSTAITAGVIAGVWSRDILMLPGGLKALVKAYADRSPLYNVEDGLPGSAFRFTTRAFCLDPPDPHELGVASLSPGGDEVVANTLKVGAGILNAGRLIAHTNEAVVDYITGGIITPYIPHFETGAVRSLASACWAVTRTADAAPGRGPTAASGSA
jgi:subtilisin family serine protease